MLKEGDRVRSRFGFNYEIVAILDGNLYKCRRLHDGKIITLSKDNFIKTEKED